MEINLKGEYMKSNVVLIAIVLLALSGCAKNGSDGLAGAKGDTGSTGSQGGQGEAGANGADGSNGSDGHSLVSMVTLLEIGDEICPSGGQSLDIYLDTDSSLSVTENDFFENSLIACNGSNGLDGNNGLDGTNGADGTQGESGPQGDVGPQGVAGNDGIQGPVGPEGASGPQGLTGAQGESGSGATIVAYSQVSCTSISGTSFWYKQNGASKAGLYSASSCSTSSHIVDLGTSGDSRWLAAKVLAVFDATAGNSNGIRVVTFN